MRGKDQIAPIVKKTLRAAKMMDKEFMDTIRSKIKFACKPCWELKYCPYGAIVEDYPTPPQTLEDAQSFHEHYRKALEQGTLFSTPMTEEIREETQANFDAFDPEDYIGHYPKEVEEMACNVFLHFCPVFFEAEEISETSTARRRGRYIPFDVKMRVVRRDNYTCQSCGKHLLDNEVEFDHIIPVSKGGSTEEHNIRLTCYDCNREKTNRVEI